MPSPINTNDFTAQLKPAYDGAATIAEERSCSSIDVNGLSSFLLDNGFLERQSRVVKLLEKEKVFSKTNQLNLARPDRYKLGLARAKKLRRMADEYGWTDADYSMASYLVDEMSPYALNTTMFKVTLHEQLSDEQKKYWLPRHKRWDVVGAYAQTELGHGSNVRGLELEARWDPHTKDFVLHSPTLTASKWWNGSLGCTASHAIVVAQLLLPENKKPGSYTGYGPHTFIVQVRDEKTRKPLAGIAVGDIGPKYGYASMDNGYMLFDHHRIPHSALCAKFSGVDKDTGEYIKPKNSKVVYGSLTATRKEIIMHARLVLARAVTIAIRYTAIRRQFRDEDSSSRAETKVLDYSSVQIRLLPLLATTFALHFGGKRMGEVYDDARQNIEKGNFGPLNDMHSLSSGLKSLCTMLAADGIETCRRAMGGHGFGGASGMVGLNADYLSKPTVEGDNWMITQQLARYLLKKARGVIADPTASPNNRTEENLQQYWKTRDQTQSQKASIFSSDEATVAAFERRAAYLTFQARDALDVQRNTWNSRLVQLFKLSKAHSEAVLVYCFHDGLCADNSLPTATKDILWKLFRLFALYTIDNSSREFYKAGAITDAQLDGVAEQVLSLMAEVRPHCVRLVDAWAVPEYLLDSALGRSDGKVYEDLFNRAHRLNPLNKLTFNPDYRLEELVMGENDGDKILAKL